jgi:L-amino acid N-acyltransferase YncA
VIAFPRTQTEWAEQAAFLREHALVQPSDGLRMMGWRQDGRLVMVVGFDGFIGRVCNVHVAMAPGFAYTPRQLLDEFASAFDQFGICKMIGVVNSKNARALRYDLHLGFKEVHRLAGMHDDGGDIVFLVLDKDDYRYKRERLAA